MKHESRGGVASALVSLACLTGAGPGSAASLTHGPVLYAGGPEGMVVFARTDTVARVSVEYSADSTFAVPELTGAVLTHLDDDFTAHVEISGLEPRTTYHYRLLVDEERVVPEAGGNFLTFPPDTAFVEFHFSIVADMTSGIADSVGAPVFAELVKTKPAFVIGLGDMDHRDPSRNQEGKKPPEDSWRKMHRDMIRDSLTGRDFSTYIGPYYAFFPIWDDHDYGINDGNRTEPWKDRARDRFFEYHPVPNPPNPDVGSGIHFAMRRPSSS